MSECLPHSILAGRGLLNLTRHGTPHGQAPSDCTACYSDTRLTRQSLISALRDQLGELVLVKVSAELCGSAPRMCLRVAIHYVYDEPRFTEHKTFKTFTSISLMDVTADLSGLSTHNRTRKGAGQPETKYIKGSEEEREDFIN